MEVQVLLVGGLVCFAVGLNAFWFKGRFLFNKNSSVKFHMLNGTVHSGWTDPTPHVFLFLQAEFKGVVLGTTILLMERDISVRQTELTEPVKGDHLQSWSRLFRSDQTEMVCFIWCTSRNFQIFGLNGKPPRSSRQRLKYFHPPNIYLHNVQWIWPWLLRRWIALSTGLKIYPADNTIGFPNTYSLDSDLSGG